MRFCSPENVTGGRVVASSSVMPTAGQALVPVHLEVVAAVVTPIGERMRVRHRIFLDRCSASATVPPIPATPGDQ